ncbi:MAG: hypothetical protein K2X87_11000 [Gemmataceae bacterium]|nr:hypothetical protein [Gemmataceae bacterium]
MRVVHLPDLATPTDEPPDPEFVTDLYAGRARGWGCTWPEVLAMAVRDGAASVHFHPWRTNGVQDNVLSYQVGGVVYGLIRPAEAEDERLLAHARELLAPGRRARWWGRLTRAATVGHLRLVAASGDETDWCGVVWSAGGVSGVDFHRLDPAPVVPPVEPAVQPVAG